MLLRNSVRVNVLTAYDVQRAERDEAKTVKRSSSRLLLQFLGQNLCLLVHYFQELGQYGEVKSRGQHLPPPAPFVTCTTTVERERQECEKVIHVKVLTEIRFGRFAGKIAQWQSGASLTYVP